MTRTIMAALLTALIASSATADPNPQLVASVEARLAHFGLSADVSQFATSTVGRLHMTLVQRETYSKKRRELVWILQHPNYK